MTRWYRAYEGTCSDPKLAEAALDADLSRAVAIAAWHLILENACAINDGGRIDISPRRIAAALCEPLAQIETLHSSFAAIGLIAGSHVSAWKRRQYESDNSTARSQKHRAKQKTAETLPPAEDATLHDRCATPPETETETEVPLANANGLSAVDVTKAIFKTGVAILTEAGTAEKQARSLIGMWRKRYGDPAVLAMLGRCPRNLSEPKEWITKALQTEAGNGKREYQTGKRNGIADALDREIGFSESAGASERRAIGRSGADGLRAIAGPASG